MNEEASRWIQDLSLQPHPEGGFYRETQRSSRCTTILYLLPAKRFSAWHRVLGADETWHHYAGDPLRLLLLGEEGPNEIVLGGHHRGGVFHAVVPADLWQAAAPFDGAAGFSLVGCTVAPPFTFDRFELGTAEFAASWLARWPEHRALLSAYARECAP